MTLTDVGRPVGTLFRRIKRGLIQEVPQADALCEFDCGKRQCHMGDWENCPRRLAFLRSLDSQSHGGSTT